MRSRNSGFSLVEMGIVVGMLALICMLALEVVPTLLAKSRASRTPLSAKVLGVTSAPVSASDGSPVTASSVTDTVPLQAGPLTRQFHDVELINSVQAIDTLPDAQKPSDFASRGDWLYVVTDKHVLVNGRWADALCPAFLAGRQKVASGTSLVALRGLLYQRVENKRRMAVKGLELMGGQSVDVSKCAGVSANRAGFSYMGQPVAFATELTLPR